MEYARWIALSNVSTTVAKPGTSQSSKDVCVEEGNVLDCVLVAEHGYTGHLVSYHALERLVENVSSIKVLFQHIIRQNRRGAEGDGSVVAGIGDGDSE